MLNTIEANMRTEDLLEQSQSLAEELQSRQQELQKTNQELPEAFPGHRVVRAPTGSNPRIELPARAPEPTPVLAPPIDPAPTLLDEVGDDREQIDPGDRVLLIIENDISFARLVLESGRERGFKGLCTSLGAAGLVLARERRPSAITLDLHLPDIDGWRVLDRLKSDLATRHIPICVISTDDARVRSLRSGAQSFVGKPLQSKDVLDTLIDGMKRYLQQASRTLFLVDEDAIERARLLDSLRGDDLDLQGFADLSSVLLRLRDKPVDCLVLKPGGRGAALRSLSEAMERIPELRPVPVVIYGAAERVEADRGWQKLEQVAGVLRRAQSPERLLDQCTLLLHRDLLRLPEPQRRVLIDLHQSDKLLAGKKVLIVDDDMRNIFALSAVLEDHEVTIASADNGRDAIQILQSQPDIDLVLMDIMMPEMDGIETMQEIRKFPALKNLPIIAVTAKAMKGDREKCIEAGAWDYLAKPVDSNEMLAVMRAWLHR